MHTGGELRSPFQLGNTAGRTIGYKQKKRTESYLVATNPPTLIILSKSAVIIITLIITFTRVS